jgi:hypothetical protein
LLPKRKKSTYDDGGEGEDRRKHPRRLENLPVFFQVINSQDPSIKSGTRQGILKDLGAGGMCFLTEEIRIDGLHISFEDSPLRKNTLFIKIVLPPPYGPVLAMGQVVWFERPFGEHQRYAVGVEFIGFQHGHQDALRRFLKERS